MQLLSLGFIRCGRFNNNDKQYLRITITKALILESVKFLIITRYGVFWITADFGGSSQLSVSILSKAPTSLNPTVEKISDTVFDIYVGQWTSIMIFSFSPSDGSFDWNATRINK